MGESGLPYPNRFRVKDEFVNWRPEEPLSREIEIWCDGGFHRETRRCGWAIVVTQDTRVLDTDYGVFLMTEGMPTRQGSHHAEIVALRKAKTSLWAKRAAVIWIDRRHDEDLEHVPPIRYCMVDERKRSYGYKLADYLASHKLRTHHRVRVGRRGRGNNGKDTERMFAAYAEASRRARRADP